MIAVVSAVTTLFVEIARGFDRARTRSLLIQLA
jgi:hypothetical protein